MGNSRLKALKSRFNIDAKWVPALRGVASDGFATLVVTLANLIAIPFYINYLGARNYGIWITVFSLVGIVSLFEIGVDQYIVSRLSNVGEKITNSTHNLLSKVFIIKLYTTLVYIVLGVFFYNYYDIFISESNNFHKKIQTIIMALTSYYVLNLYINLYNAVLISRQKFLFINISTAIFSILAIIITLGTINFGLGIESFSIGLLISAFIQLLIYILYVKRMYCFDLNNIRISNNFDKEMVSYSISFQILKIAFYYRSQLINIVINNTVGPYAVTVFNIVTRLCAMGGTIINKIISPIFPQLVIEVSNNTADILFIKINSLVVRITIFFAIMIYFINPLFIKMWVGSGYDVGGSYLGLYLVYFILIQSMSLYGMVIYSTRRFEKWPFLSIVEIFISLILAFTLGNMIGMQGIIIAMILSSLITQLYIFNIVLKQLNINKIIVLNSIIKNAIYPNILIVFFLVFIGLTKYNDNIYLILFILFIYNIIYELIKKRI